MPDGGSRRRWPGPGWWGAAERIPRVRQRHVERVDLRDPDVGEDPALITPVDLGLSSGHDLEPAVQAGQLTRADAQLIRDPRPGLLQVHLHALVVAGEPVLRHQTLMDHRPLEQDLRPQHRVDQRGDLIHHPLARLTARSPLRRRNRHLTRQVLGDRAPVQPGRLRDLPQAHRTRLVQPAKPPQLQPPMRVQHHCQPPSADPQPTTADSRPQPCTASTTVHSHPYEVGACLKDRVSP